MTLQNLVLQKRASIVDRWYRLLLDSYPPETAKFLAQENDRFQNPVGQTMAPAIEQIFALLVEGREAQDLADPLDDIIRIRAVQDFTASQAIAFIFDLKQVIHEELAGELAGELAAQRTGAMQADLRALERRIERAGLLAFDIYVQCREQIYQIKADEIRRRTAAILRRHHYVVNDTEAELGPEAGP
jgi:hypothetical protein